MTTPTLDEASLPEASTERDFWEEHGQELLAKHPDQFVAVYQGRVAGVNSDLLKLTADLETKGLSPSQLWIKFLNTHPEQMVL